MSTYPTKQFPFGLLLIFLIGFGYILLMAIPKSWQEATKTQGDGSVTLADTWSRTIDRKKEKLDEQELYMLTAARDGYYLCNHCPTGKFFLKKDEIYRYGTTGDGANGRGYNKKWLAKNSLLYVYLLTADLKTIKSLEITYIGNYVMKPENLKRPLPNNHEAKPYWYRLVLPPGNNSLD